MLMFLWSLWLVLFTSALLVRSLHMANAQYCPEWRTFFTFSMAAPLTPRQWASIMVVQVIFAVMAYVVWYFLGHQLFTYVAVGLLSFWLLLILLDGLTWWLPHMFTHSLWIIILLLSSMGIGLALVEALLSGALGFMGLWGLHKFSLWYWHKPGFGGGDLFLSGALASWFGWFQLGNLWLLAAVYSLLLVVLLKLFSNQWKSYVPFGPGLGLAAISMLMADIYQSSDYVF